MRPLEVLKGKGVGVLLRQALSGVPGAAAPALEPPVPPKPLPGRHVCRGVNLQDSNDHIDQKHLVESVLSRHAC